MHEIAQALEQIELQEEITIVLVSRKVQIETSDERDQELAFAQLMVVVTLILFAMLEQVVYPGENRLNGLVVRTIWILNLTLLG